jgi:hypothetical protein
MQKDIEIKPYVLGDHYPEICEWWRKRAHQGWTFVPSDHLSSLGLVASIDGKNLAAGWLYLTNSRWALTEFLITNPDASPKDSIRGLKDVLRGLEVLALEYGAATLFTSVENEGLRRLLQKEGFEIGGNHMTNLHKRIAL